MNLSATRAQVIAEVASTKPTENSRDATRLYEKWCHANAVPVFPAASESEQQVLRFLHSNHREHGWRWGTCTNYALGIAQAFQRAGQADPRGPRLKAWLLAVKRQEAGRPATRRADALTGEQITRAATRATSKPDTKVKAIIRLRGVIAVSEACGLDPTAYGAALQHLPRTAFNQRQDDIVITAPTGRRHILDRARQPEFFAALTTALNRSSGRDRPLQDERSSGRPLTVRDTRVLRAAWDRSTPRGTPRVSDRAASWREAWSASTTNDRLWWLRCLDPDFEARVQDIAYLLVGIQTAFRHQTLRQLTVGSVAATTTGFVQRVAPVEHKGGLQAVANRGRPRELTKFVDHLGEGGASTCPGQCPACALSSHIQVRQRRGATDTDLLWVNRHGRALARHNAQQRMRSLIGPPVELDGQATQVIGTRSLRVTAATLARELGMSPTQIAAFVTDHRNPATAELYVRRADPFSFELTLSLT